MTLLILTVLVCAWAGYFAYYLRDSRLIVSQRRDGTAAFSRSLGALGDSVVGKRNRSSHAFNRGAGPLGDPAMVGGSNGRLQAGDIRAARSGVLLDRPRTPHEASRRRRHVFVVLVATALVSLVTVVVFGVGFVGWVVHGLLDIALLSFLVIAAHSKHRSAEYEMRAMLLHHGRSESLDEAYSAHRDAPPHAHRGGLVAHQSRAAVAVG